MRIVAALTVVLLANIAAAQPVFEVASIRPHNPASDGAGPQLNGNRLALIGRTLKQLIIFAYDLKSYEYSGGPDWAAGPMDGNSFDMIAQTESGDVLTEAQAKRALQTLLADRFQVKIHRETKEMPVYVLVVGKNGPKFAPSTSNSSGVTRGSVTTGTVTSTFSKQGTDSLVRLLSASADRPVLDETGLTGLYDFKLEYARDPAASDGVAPSIFTAVQEQLGLKLESQKAPIEILVVDSAERPTAN